MKGLRLLSLLACFSIGYSHAVDIDVSQETLYFNEEFAAKATVNDDRLFAEAASDRIAFWEKCADELVWFKKWDKTLSWDPPFAKWFEGGTINISYNCLDRHLKDNKGDKVALIHISEDGTKRILTYDELYLEVNKLASAMKQLGIKKGDRVAIYMPMVPEAIASMLACTRIGAVHTVVFGGIGAHSVKERILDAEASLLITADGSYRSGKKVIYKGSVDSVLDECPTLSKVLVYNNINEPVTLKNGRDFWYHEALAQAERYSPPEHLDAEDLLFILYTSGTTGKPKGIFHTTGGYLVGVHSSFKWVFDIKEDDVYWSTADIGWITGHSYVVYGPLANGATQVIYEGGFDWPQKNRFAQIIDDNKVSIFYTAPTLVRMFMQWGDECLKNSSLQSLRLLGSIGEPINPESWLWYYEKIGQKKCPIIDTWFQTETGALVISPLPGLTKLKPGSITQALPGYTVDIFNEEGVSCDKGFLAITSPYPSMMRGIYKDPQRYKDTYWCKWEGKYYYAGDVATRDEDGYIRVGGRSDEVLKIAGHRIGTAEIENALIECPKVAESAVIGVKDSLKGQKIVAFVILKGGEEPYPKLESELKNLVAEYVGAYARPAKIVFVKHLPKTRSGKILRRILKNLVEGEPVGDTATLSDPSIMGHLSEVCEPLNKEFYLSEVVFSKISAPPELRDPPEVKNFLEGAEICEAVRPYLQAHLEELNYDRIHLINHFLTYYRTEKLKRPTLLPIKAMEELDTQLDVKKCRGGSCFSLVGDLFDRLPKGLFAYKIPSILPEKFYQPGFPKLCHVAIVIPFEASNEGVVLLEPNFDIPEPIVLVKGGDGVIVDLKDKGKRVYRYEDDTISCCDPISGISFMTYYLKEYLNSEGVGPKAMTSVDQRLSLVSRDSLGYHRAHLNVNFKLSEVQYSINYEKMPVISFDDFLAGKQIDEATAHLLNSDPIHLNQMLETIIKERSVLERLRHEYFELLHQKGRSEEFVL